MFEAVIETWLPFMPGGNSSAQPQRKLSISEGILNAYISLLFFFFFNIYIYLTATVNSIHTKTIVLYIYIYMLNLIYTSALGQIFVLFLTRQDLTQGDFIVGLGGRGGFTC